VFCDTGATFRMVYAFRFWTWAIFYFGTGHDVSPTLHIVVGKGGIVNLAEGFGFQKRACFLFRCIYPLRLGDQAMHAVPFVITIPGITTMEVCFPPHAF